MKAMVFVVCKPDRLARSTADLLSIVERLGEGVSLVVLSRRSAGGHRSGHREVGADMLGAIVAFEPDLMLERQREEIAKPRSEGKYKGRVPTLRRQAE